MKGTSINFFYIAPNALIDTNADNRTISLGKDATLNNSGIFKRRQKTKGKRKQKKIDDSLHYWTDESRLSKNRHTWAQIININNKSTVPALSWAKFIYISNNLRFTKDHVTRRYK